MSLSRVSGALAKIVGTGPMKRTEVLKQVWSYIKTNNLQNPADKKEILCDVQLRDVTKVDKVSMFGLLKHFSPFIETIPGSSSATLKVKKPRVKQAEAVEVEVEEPKKVKKAKSATKETKAAKDTKATKTTKATKAKAKK